MSAVPMPEVLRDAFARRYGVGDLKIVNDVTMLAVLEAAAETRSLVIVQVSVKTVKQLSVRLLRELFQEMARRVPIVLHGGTGLKHEVFRELIRLGAVKVNISTQLKIIHTDGLRSHLNANPAPRDPAKLHDAVRKEVRVIAAG